MRHSFGCRDTPGARRQRERAREEVAGACSYRKVRYRQQGRAAQTAPVCSAAWQTAAAGKAQARRARTYRACQAVVLFAKLFEMVSICAARTFSPTA